MSAFSDVNSLIQATPTRGQISFESSFGTPSTSPSESCQSILQFPMSPPEAVFVVPPPSMLLNSPLIRQKSRIPFSISQENSSSPEISQILQISRQQIEYRLAQNGIETTKIWQNERFGVLGESSGNSNLGNSFEVDSKESTARANSTAKSCNFRQDLKVIKR